MVLLSQKTNLGEKYRITADNTSVEPNLGYHNTADSDF